MNTKVPSIGDRIKVDVIGETVNGYVTGFNKKDGRKIVEYQPGEAPPARGVAGSNWTWVENILEIGSAKQAASAVSSPALDSSSRLGREHVAPAEINHVTSVNVGSIMDKALENKRKTIMRPRG